jgi:hypothetical protein
MVQEGWPSNVLCSWKSNVLPCGQLAGMSLLWL